MVAVVIVLFTLAALEVFLLGDESLSALGDRSQWWLTNRSKAQAEWRQRPTQKSQNEKDGSNSCPILRVEHRSRADSGRIHL